MAKLVSFLASDDSDSVTEQATLTGGGVIMNRAIMGIHLVIASE